MQKAIKRPGVKLILDGEGVTLCRGLLRKKRKFLPWDEIAAVGFYVGDMRHVGYSLDTLSFYPMEKLDAQLYSSYDLFLYFSVFKPEGFALEHMMPVIREKRNICINLGGGEFTAVSSIIKRADVAAEKILAFYGGKIINRGAQYHG